MIAKNVMLNHLANECQCQGGRVLCNILELYLVRFPNGMSKMGPIFILICLGEKV